MIDQSWQIIGNKNLIIRKHEKILTFHADTDSQKVGFIIDLHNKVYRGYNSNYSALVLLPEVY